MPMTRILVVDDNKDFLETLSYFFEKSGYDVSEASSVADAIDILSRASLDVVLTDIRVGRLSGTAILEYMRSSPKGQNTVIIGMTAYHDERETQRSGERFHALLIKPFPLDTLLGQIEMLLSSRPG